MNVIKRKMFQHGKSKAITLPKDFVDHVEGLEVVITYSPHQVCISPKPELDTIESDPLFVTFIQAIAHDAMKHPEKLKDLNEVSKELDELLEGVPLDTEDDDE
jgi:virulence-associated protein VagC